ncbi:Tol biopolymer transport system component [Pontibacter aydingkolensis]|uniref:WD40-like Beta Propeller Repeat n=1 Tax=Pontibacter aydingkolensis TaxID=1911536 RepID=A0ABS7CT31_9BACT|nr:hypothetical protein [Pontibacter aydingkolensis]MBW7466647.1 hypothetical protein [Pontibacter aydingkolensis]
MRLYTRLLLLFLLSSLTVNTLQAQPGRDVFGKSRIQYKNFDWQLYSTQNFNIYFYSGGKQAAINAAEYAEKELKRITSLIGYYPYSKITLILYNSTTDLRQSNIGLDQDQYQTGGETLFMKNKIELAFEGTQTEFKRDLSFTLTELLLNDMMYGGSLKEALQSSYLLRLPDWFISGVAAYTAEGWSIEMDNFMRDMQQEAKQNPQLFFTRDAELTGQSIWNYIAERYGYTAIQNILNLTRITRDVEIGITSSLNLPYKRFLQDWNNYYVQINTSSENQLVPVPAATRLFSKNKQGHRYSEPTLNPAGTHLAYAEMDNGNFKIIVQEVRTRKDKVVWRGGYKTMDQMVDYELPVLAWRSNNQLGFIEARRGKMTLRQVDARDRYTLLPLYENLTTPAVTLDQFTQVYNMSYSEDGQSIVVSASKDGQTDIFLLNANGRLQKQLTKDIYDDIHPVFLRGGQGVAFSSNRWVDTTGTAPDATFGSVVNNYDIFLLDQQGVNLRQLTSSVASELRPRATDDGNLVYLSEASGIRSIYRYDISTGTSKPLTNFIQGIDDYDYNASNNTLAFVAKDRSRDFVYLLPDFAPTSLQELPKTSRQIILETRVRVPQQSAATRKLLESESKKKVPARTNGEINIDNYQFSADEKQAAKTDSAKVNTAPVKRATTATANQQIAGPLDYDVRFSVHEIITSVYADPQLGFGIVAGVNMSDLFENHHIRGSAFIRTDLETSRIWAEYMNLKNRVDLGMQFRRDIILTEVPETGARLRFSKNEFSPTLVYPLSHSTSLRAQPKFVNTRFTFVNSFATPDSITNFGGANVELVYDNSVSTGVNMREGSRMKVGILSLRGFDESSVNFSKFYVDLRHYQKLHRQIILATRIGYGSFFGNSPKRFLIGGMDNWLLADDDEESEQNDILIQSPADLFYLEYATPLRGFSFNTRNGTKYLMANAELRVPIVQYLYNGPIPSGFFRNLQLTAFADAGSAYNGSNPFTGNNSINTRVIGGRTSPTEVDPFEITVINYRNPFLLGYGFGARTTLLGVYGKLDVAWGEEDYERKGPKFYITLGYDF